METKNQNFPPAPEPSGSNPEKQKVSNNKIIIAVGIGVFIFIAVVIAGIYFGIKKNTRIRKLQMLSQAPEVLKAENVSGEQKNDIEFAVEYACAFTEAEKELGTSIGEEYSSRVYEKLKTVREKHGIADMKIFGEMVEKMNNLNKDDNFKNEFDKRVAERGCMLNSDDAKNNIKSDGTDSNLSTGIEDMPTSLVNTFKDDSAGFEVTYPEGWTFEKSTKISPGDTKIEFWPAGTGSEVKVRIENMGTSNLSVDERVDAFITFTKATAKMFPNGKNYEEKDFIYKFEDGKTLTGKQAKVEYDWQDKKHYKEWVIIVPYKEIVYMFDYKAPLDQYDLNLDKAISMLDSWKIMKK